jgi:hypothetical protein
MSSDQIRIGVTIIIASTGGPVYIFYESVNTSHQSESVKQKQNEVKKEAHAPSTESLVQWIASAYGFETETV